MSKVQLAINNVRQQCSRVNNTRAVDIVVVGGAYL